MVHVGLLLFGLLVLGWALTAGRMGPTPLTGPMVFTAAGLLLGPEALDLVDLGVDDEMVRVLAEATLTLVLFTDAARIDCGRLRREHAIPVRLLVVGFPLVVILGTAAALPLFGGLGLAGAVLLAAVLAPTDAALGQAVLTDRSVPVRIRQALNVESGLNDGLALPLVTLGVALASEEAESRSVEFWALFVVRQVGLGLAVGVVVGLIGGRLVQAATGSGWTGGMVGRLAVVALAVVAFAGAEAATGNGFVAAFVAGLTLGTMGHDVDLTAFTELEGQLLGLLTFFVFGAVLVSRALPDLDWRIAVYTVASLTVVRGVAVAASLVGTGVRPRTVAFLGWFGPRGLASVLFVTLVLEDGGLAGADRIASAAAWVILVSVVAHGATAGWLSRRYGRWAERAHADDRPCPETEDMADDAMQPVCPSMEHPDRDEAPSTG